MRPYRYFCKKRNFILLHRINAQYAVNEKSFFWSFIWVWRQWALHNQCQIWANLNFIKEKKRNIQKIDLLMERPNIGYLCLLFNPYQLISLYACFWIKYFLNLTRPLFDSQKHQQLCKMAKCLGHSQILKQWDYPWSLMIKVTKAKILLRNYWWTKCRLESCRSLS